MSIRNLDELKTLARTLDLILAGKVVEVGDMLAQRFMAVEAADVEDH